MRDRNMFGKLHADIHKSIRIDYRTNDIIENYRGLNFSEKLRNFVFDKSRIKHAPGTM